MHLTALSALICRISVSSMSLREPPSTCCASKPRSICYIWILWLLRTIRRRAFYNLSIHARALKKSWIAAKVGGQRARQPENKTIKKGKTVMSDRSKSLCKRQTICTGPWRRKKKKEKCRNSEVGCKCTQLKQKIAKRGHHISCKIQIITSLQTLCLWAHCKANCRTPA